MPRITYTDRFDALLAKDYVSARDRVFAESLYSHYKRKRSLTTGRRRCFLQLEERYAARPVPLPGADELDVLLQRIQQTAGNGWNYEFVGSVQSQLQSGRPLSQRQEEILAEIKVKFSDEKMADRDAFVATWDTEKAEAYRVVMAYYRPTGYFTKLTAAHAENPEIIPSLDDYNRVTTNKFAMKVLEGWFAAPKFPVGSMVAMGAGATYAMRQACGNSGLGVIVAVNAATPTSAARGCKMYKILPVGGATTFLCEERALKRARAPKKRKA